MSILDLTQITVKKLLLWIKGRIISLTGGTVVLGDIFINMNMRGGTSNGDMARTR